MNMLEKFGNACLLVGIVMATFSVTAWFLWLLSGLSMGYLWLPVASSLGAVTFGILGGTFGNSL